MRSATLGTHVLALIGVAAFMFLHLPLPWLFGPMVSCLIAAFRGMPLQAIKPLNAAMRTILGVAVGASVTLPFLMSLPSLWQTLIIVPIMVVLIGAIGVPYFQKLCGYNFPTSYYASMPGGLQDMLVFGAEAGGNLRAISLIHATRVLIIVTVLPALLTWFWDVDLTKPPGAPASSIDVLELALMVFCGLAGWRIAKWAGLFGASILGPLILTAGFSLAGLITHRPPAEAIWAAQFFIGITIGVNYRGITLAELRKDVLGGVGFSAILVVLTAAALVIISAFDLAPLREALLSLTPGGQAELVVLSIIIGADVGFVIAHHLFRLFVVILGAPIAARLFSRGPRD